MTTRKFLLLMIAAASLSLRLAAQRPAPSSKRAFSDTVYSGLGLTPDQLARLHELEQRYAKELQGLSSDTDDAFNALRSKREKDIARILSPEQFKKWRKTGRAPTDKMPIAPRKGPKPRMPIEDQDTVHDNMPVVKPRPEILPH